MTDPSVVMLEDAIGVNQTLQKLAIGYMNIGDPGAEALARALRVNHALQELDCRGNGITSRGTEALTEALKVNTTLKAISLDDNSINYVGVRHIAGCLATNKTLTALGLNKNTFYNASDVVKAMNINQSIAEHRIGQNRIYDGIERHIADCLRNNNSIQKLDLAGHVFRPRETELVLSSLQVNTCLHQLSLTSVYYAEKNCAETLATTIRVNTTLKELSFVYQSKFVGKIVIEAMEHNKTIEKFLYGDPQNPHERIQSLARRNALWSAVTHFLQKEHSLEETMDLLTDLTRIDPVDGKHGFTNLSAVYLMVRQGMIQHAKSFFEQTKEASPALLPGPIPKRRKLS